MDEKIFWDKVEKISELSVKSGLGMASQNRTNYKNTLRILAQGGAKNAAKLQNLLNGNDIKGFCAEIHGMKGSLTLAGATALSVKAKNLEDASRRGDTEYLHKNIKDFTDRVSRIAGELKGIIDEADKADIIMRAATRNVLPPGLLGTLMQLSNAMDSSNPDIIFSEADKLNAMEFSGRLDNDIRELTDALQIMNYDTARVIIRRLTGNM